MSKKDKKNKRKSKNNGLETKIKNRLRGVSLKGTKSFISTLSNIRVNLKSNSYKKLLALTSQYPEHDNYYIPSSHVNNYDEILLISVLEPIELFDEINWCIEVLTKEIPKLNNFNALKNNLAKSLLKSNEKSCLEILNTIECNHGKSIWLTMTKIASLQSLQGTEAQKKYRDEIISSSKLNSLISNMTSHFSHVNEESATFNRVYSSTIEHINNSDIDDENKVFLKYKLLNSIEKSTNPIETHKACSSILRSSQATSIYDLYESLIDVLLYILTIDDAYSQVIAQKCNLDKLVNINDHRLSTVLLRCSFSKEIADRIPRRDLSADDCYLTGDYSEAINKANNILNKDPEDIDTLLTKAKSYIVTDGVEDDKTLSGIFSRHIINLYSHDKENHLDTWHKLLKLSFNFRGFNFSEYFQHYILSSASGIPCPANKLEKSKFLRSTYIDPSLIFGVPQSLNNNYSEYCLDIYKESITADYWINHAFGYGKAKHTKSYNNETSTLGKVYKYISHGEYSKVSKTIDNNTQNKNKLTCISLAVSKCYVLIETGDFIDAVNLIVEYCLDSNLLIAL